MDINVASYNDLSDEIKSMIKDGNVFFQNEYSQLSINTNKNLIYLYTEDFVIPIQVVKRILFRYGIFPSEPISINGKVDYSDFLDHCIHAMKKYKLNWIINTVSSEFEYFPKNSKYSNFGTFIIDLRQDQDFLWKKVDSKHKNSIRRAERENVRIIYGDTDLIDSYLKIDIQTKDRSNLRRVDFTYYQLIMNNLKNTAKIFLALSENNEPQAGAIIFYNKSKGYYIHGASKNNSLPGSANLLLWRVVQYLKENNVNEFSFVGYRHDVDKESKFYGIQRFKEKFGGTIKNTFIFRYEYCKICYFIYSLLIGIFSLKKLGRYYDIVDQIKKGEK